MIQELTSVKKRSSVTGLSKTPGQDQQKYSMLKKDPGYYRSQAFLSGNGLNPLVAAAYPLLTIGARLSELDQYSDIAHLYQILVHEMRAFENQSRHREYRQNIIIIARYLLCLFLDETILQSTWGKSWKHCCLQATFHHEDNSEERAFEIVNRLLSQPTQYIDVLELSYLCFSFGLKNQKTQNMSVTFLERLDKIYHTIREERGEISHGFLVEDFSNQPTTKRKNTFNWSFSLTLSFFMIISLFGYGFFCYGLKLASEPLTQQLLTFSGN